MDDDLISRILPGLVPQGTHCLDIGGHYGAFTYELTAHVAPERITIIEPSPAKVPLLRRSFPRCRVIDCAVSDQPGTVTFFEALDNPGLNLPATQDPRARIAETAVDCRRLDDLLADAEEIGFIKIDVEGYEYEALRGGEALLARWKPTILFECGAARDLDLGEDKGLRLFGYLTGTLGYQVYPVFDIAFQRPPISAADFQRYRTFPFLAFNYVARHPDREPALAA